MAREPALLAITGASGFIGRELSRQALLQGYRVRGVVRDAIQPLPDGVERSLIEGLDDCAGLEHAFAGASAVVHLAGRVHLLGATGPEALPAFRRDNVEGTRNVVQAMAAANVRRLVFASSIKVMGEESPSPYTDSSVPSPVDPYGISKLEAEAVIREAGDHGAVEATILRLPLVYGPAATANVRRLVSLVARGIPLPFSGVRNQRSLVYLGNVAHAMLCVLKSAAAAGETFFVDDGEPISTPDLLHLIGEMMGRPARLFYCPGVFLHLMGGIGDLLGKVIPMPISSAEVQRLTGSLAVDTQRLERVTGCRPPSTTRDGWRATVQWFQHARAK